MHGMGDADALGKLELELRRGVVVLATLSQLRAPRYGYELRQALADEGMPIEEGTLYPLLRRLESQGVLKSEWKIDGGRDANAYLNLTPYLGTALRENSGLRIFVGQGYYDFATPFFAAEYALSRSGIPQDRIQFHYYHAGHMMYVRDEDRTKLTRDIREFIRSR